MASSGVYKGLYCVGCEEYLPNKNKANKNVCSACLSDLVIMSEQTIFLNISNDDLIWLRKVYKKGIIKVFPSFYIDEILKSLNTMPNRMSISRLSDNG